MNCNAEAYKRIEAARKLLASNGFISERENTKVEQRVKRWIRDSGLKPAELLGKGGSNERRVHT
jgi:hypothetical protein